MKTWNSVLWLAMAFVMTAPSGELEGGTVFLKNGYAIQGKITVSDDTRVVVSFYNGSTTIYRRFIDEVILEAAEEVAIEARKEALARAPSVVVGGGSFVEPVLPENLSDFFPQTETATETSVISGRGRFDQQDEMPVVEKADPVFRRITLDVLGIALVLPAGWSYEESEEGVRFTPEDPSAGWLAVDRFRGSDVNLDSALAGLSMRLEERGFSTGISDGQVPLEIPGSSATLSGRERKGDGRCDHALIGASDGLYLIGWYPGNDSGAVQEEMHALSSSMEFEVNSPR